MDKNIVLFISAGSIIKHNYKLSLTGCFENKCFLTASLFAYMRIKKKQYRHVMAVCDMSLCSLSFIIKTNWTKFSRKILFQKTLPRLVTSTIDCTVRVLEGSIPAFAFRFLLTKSFAGLKVKMHYVNHSLMHTTTQFFKLSKNA